MDKLTEKLIMAKAIMDRADTIKNSNVISNISKYEIMNIKMCQQCTLFFVS